MKDPQDAYSELVQMSRERAMLSSCLELLGWDELTYMPAGGVKYRGHVMAWLAGLDHTMGTDPRFAEMLSVVEGSPLLTEETGLVAANVRRWRRDRERMTLVPKKLVEELAEVTATAQRVWADARQNNDFSEFAPWLEKIVQMKQHEARCRGGSDNLYDGFLQDYEPHVTTAELVRLFADLRQELAKLLDAIRGSRRSTSDSLLHREYPIERQKIFAESIAADIGYDFHRGRLDSTTHPFFAAVGPGDCRITTRYSTHDFGDAFFSMMHEMGHGLYEQGLDPALCGTPVGEAPSTGVHESQSQLWEKFIGRERSFWGHVFPRARDIFHDCLHNVTVDEFYQAINHVNPSWNRVRADPVTYDLHILIRFELEMALIQGDLSVAELPGAWNDAYEKYLGIRPADDAKGCLQDGHWSAGMFGYFPVYTLGNIYAAQFYEAAKKSFGNLDAQFEKGQFGELIGWLKKEIYTRGGLDDSAALVEQVTGQAPCFRPLVDALWSRYRPLYDI